MEKVAFIMVGVSGSGKSTVQKQIIDEVKHIVKSHNIGTFSLDDSRIRFFLKMVPHGVSDLDNDASIYRMAYEYANENKKDFDAAVQADWMRALERNVIFVDNTNLSRKSRARWISDCRSKGFTVVCVQVMTTLETVLARQSTRKDKSVPLDTVKDMYMRQQEVQLGTECSMLINVDGTKPLTSDVIQALKNLVA